MQKSGKLTAPRTQLEICLTKCKYIYALSEKPQQELNANKFHTSS